MAADPAIQRSRRVLLAAAGGAIVGTAAQALGRPIPARGANGDPVTVGGTFTGTARTSIDTSGSSVTTFRAITGSGGGSDQAAIKGEAMQVGTSIGVYGATLGGVGVRGEATGAGFGVLAASAQSIGLQASSGVADYPGALGIHAAHGTGVVGKSGPGYPTFRTRTGVHGFAAQDVTAVGVVGESTLGVGVLGSSTSNDGVVGATAGPGRSGVYGVNSQADGYGVFGRNTGTNAAGYLGGQAGVAGDHPGGGTGVSGRSAGGVGVVGEAISEAGDTKGVHGLSFSPDGFGVAGTNMAGSGGAGVAGFAQSSWGESAGVQGQASSPEGYGVLADTLAESPTARAFVGHAPAGTGVLGWAGTGSHPGGLARTGVFGFSGVDAASVGVRGESPAGTGVQAVSATGHALRVSGKARFNRSGKASVPRNRNYVDAAVPGGLASNSIVSATIQMYRSGVAVAGVRPNYPSAGKIRIYLTKVASTTSSTPVAWFVVEYGS